MNEQSEKNTINPDDFMRKNTAENDSSQDPVSRELFTEASYNRQEIPDDAPDSMTAATESVPVPGPEKPSIPLESALKTAESDLNSVLDAAQSAIASLKKVKAAFRDGTIRDIDKLFESADKAIRQLRDRFELAETAWQFDGDAYLKTGAYLKELLETAQQRDFRLFEQDGRLYCYPFLVRILPSESAVMIDKKKFRKLRPTVLLDHLKDLQKKPIKFKSEPFIESLYQAYQFVVAMRDKSLIDHDVQIPLTEIYSLLTMLPGQAREYTLQEFTRDVYLLDKTGIKETKEGCRMSLHASTGTKIPRKVLTVITEKGREQVYYSIAFKRP